MVLAEDSEPEKVRGGALSKVEQESLVCVAGTEQQTR
jgi:hypothetical protein